MNTLTVYVVSGNTGSSASQIIKTALAQFQDIDVSVVLLPQVRTPEQLEAIIAQAKASRGIIVHTFVDAEIRSKFTDLAQTHHIIHVDLMGPLLSHLTRRLGKLPLGQPGLYHKMREADLKRIEAIEFALEHDDGQRIEHLQQAEIVITGVSRVGKTPLSMVVSTLGWKVANVPLVKGIEPPPILFQVDPRRVVGLTIQPGQLLAYRQRRERRLGIAPGTPYTHPNEVVEELEFAQQIFRRGKFTVIDITDRPVEESAQEIIERVVKRIT